MPERRSTRRTRSQGRAREEGTDLMQRGRAMSWGSLRSKGAAYADYVRRNSGFIPWPPR